MFEQANSNWKGIPSHRCLQCRLRPITLTLISPLCAIKYQAIRGNSRGKWPTISLPTTTFTACLSIGLHGYQTMFCIIFLRFIFVQIPSFSLQLWALAMKSTVVSQREYGNRFKKRFSKVFWELIDLLMSLQIQPPFFTSAFSEVFFPKSCLKVGGAAYTRVQLIHECLW